MRVSESNQTNYCSCTFNKRLKIKFSIKTLGQKMVQSGHFDVFYFSALNFLQRRIPLMQNLIK